MNIGIDASCWANRRGYGRYTRELLREVFAIDRTNQYCLFLDRETADRCDDLPDLPRVIVETSKAATQAAAASGRRSLGDLWAMRRAVSQHNGKLDLFYFPSVYSFFPLKSRARAVVTIHDTIAEHFPRLIFPNRRSEWLWRIKVRWAIAQADLIIAVSETAKRDVMEQFGLPDTMVKVVTDAVSPTFRPLEAGAQRQQVLERHGLRPQDRLLLYVGGISPHKNLETLVDAYALLAAEGIGPDVKLVLVGDFERDVFYSSFPAIRQKLQQLSLSDRVVFTGYVPDAELVEFYNAAELFVLPSFDEGFGLPAVEAMACGVPVVASRAGALPEVVGEAGLFVDPHSAAELKGCISRLLQDGALRQDLGRRGLQQAARYSWQRSAEAVLAAFEELVNGR
jgi:glycosyltransferase involved in cell wall biosynthesis